MHWLLQIYRNLVIKYRKQDHPQALEIAFMPYFLQKQSKIYIFGGTTTTSSRPTNISRRRCLRGRDGPGIWNIKKIHHSRCKS